MGANGAPRVSNGGMKHLAVIFVAVLAGCASCASMDARYEASLLRWKGATRAELEAAWGLPTLAAATADGTVLAWIRRIDLDERPGAPGSPVVVVNRANGVPTSTTVMPGAPAPAVVPITCTTRFVIRDEHVVSWTFEGLGCGAPS